MCLSPRLKQGNIVVGIGFNLAKLAIDLKLHNIIEIDGDQLLPRFIIEQDTIFYHGHRTHKLIIPHLARKPEAYTYIHVMLTDIDKHTFQFKRCNRSFFLVGHYGENLRHAVYKT